MVKKTRHLKCDRCGKEFYEKGFVTFILSDILKLAFSLGWERTNDDADVCDTCKEINNDLD